MLSGNFMHKNTKNASKSMEMRLKCGIIKAKINEKVGIEF